MSFIHFRDMMPPARSKPDDSPWTTYRLESSVDGQTWSIFEGPTTLDPVTVDVKNPPSYEFTSTDAPADAIYFRAVWTDANSVALPSDTLTRPEPLPAWAPSLGDVAEHIPLRTKIGNGVIVGTFTDSTKPAKADYVSRMIVKGVKRVQPLFDDPITLPADATKARDLAALWTAMLVELGLFSDQIESGQSPYTELKSMWDDETGGGEPGAMGDADDIIGRQSPSWRFEQRAPLRW